MNDEQKLIQPNLFDDSAKSVESESVVLFALGDFQSRGKTLVARQLPLDRLRGAFKRAAERFGMVEMSDEKIAEHLEKLGAKTVRVPNFVAKHPFRVTVSLELAEQAKTFYRESLEND